MALGLSEPLNMSKYQESPLDSDGGLCIVLTPLPPLCANCLKSWEPENILGLSGPICACVGVVLLLICNLLYKNQLHPTLHISSRFMVVCL